jgi:hypothetical protein
MEKAKVRTQRPNSRDSERTFHAPGRWGIQSAVLTFVVSLALLGTIPTGALGDLGTVDTPVILSCSDGHSVLLTVNATELTSLETDVNSINNLNLGLTCALDTTAVDPSTETTEWTVYDYNPSDNAIAPRNSPSSLPATTSDGTTTFDFLPGAFTALLTTTDPTMTGDRSATTLTDTIGLSGPATGFMTQRDGGDCLGNTPAAVRFYFVSPSASGPSVGSPPAGFYTEFWWSNPENLQLLTGMQSPTPITASMADPSEWSDWNGQRGDSSTSVTEAFVEATHNVQTIGLSFGGECFFETGVVAEYPADNPPPYEIFSSGFSEKT